MRIWLLRHGRTEDNDRRRYQGQRDVPLSAAGAAELRKADFSPETVFVSPLSRARETARILFPDARQEIVADLVEMDFGDFDGRSADEMAEDAAYRAWVDGGCLSRCPNGETRAEFTARTCAAVAALVERAAAEGAERLVLVAHGGTQRAVLENLSEPGCGYYDFQPQNGGGFVFEYDAALWAESRKLRRVAAVSCVRGGGTC